MCTKNSVAISFFLAVSDELKVSDLQEKKKTKTNMANQAFPKEYLNVNQDIRYFSDIPLQ